MEATIHQFPLFTRAPRPSRADVDFQAVSRPARAFTGDFYFTHRHGRTLWVVIGDVAGKGIEAAVVMAMIQEELESNIALCARENSDPTVTMTRLDLFLRRILPSNRFATVAIAQIHDDGSLVVVNGGHCALMIARRDGSVQSIDSTGPVVGLLPSPRWYSVRHRFDRGDALLAYTDGVIEARSDADEEFGTERLRDVFVEAAQQKRASSIAEAIAAAVTAHANGRRDDDLTIIVARR
jgi:serine phosphatase RsbU (regulator of sigma subunit)